jgi:hypothetical protein
MRREDLYGTPFAKYECRSREISIGGVLKLSDVRYIRETDGDYIGQIVADYKRGVGMCV